MVELKLTKVASRPGQAFSYLIKAKNITTPNLHLRG